MCAPGKTIRSHSSLISIRKCNSRYTVLQSALLTARSVDSTPEFTPCTLGRSSFARSLARTNANLPVIKNICFNNSSQRYITG